jgi:DnaJ-class molecular chaperone
MKALIENLNLAAAVGGSLAAVSLSSTSSATARSATTSIMGPPPSDTSSLLHQQQRSSFSRKSLLPITELIPRGGAQGDETSNGDDETAKPPPPKHSHKKKSHKRHTHNKHTESNSTSSSSNTSSSNNSIVQEILNTKDDDYYTILGVPRDATGEQITKAYRKRAVQTHPDKTSGDRRAFDKVAAAYDCLGDDEKRGMYDRFGITGNGSGPDQFSPSSFFEMFQQQQQQYARRNRTIRYQLQVSLEDLYKGMAKDVTVQAPTARQQTKQVQVHIQPGSVSGQAIRLSGEMDFSSDEVPGDLIFVLTQLPHPIFARKGHDLACELEISLEEAVCGLTRAIPHLDGTMLWIAPPKEKIIHNGDVQVLKCRGMPKRHAPGEYGDLYIQYKVELPKATGSSSRNNLTESERKELGRLLRKLEGGKKQSRLHTPPPPDATIHMLEPASPSDFGRASGSVVLDEDDDLDADQHHPGLGGMFGGAGGNSNMRGFYFGGSSFGSGPYEQDDGSNVQCQQM